MMGKFAAVFDPALMAIVTTYFSARIGLLSVASLFIIGRIILFFVDIEEGERMANEYLVINKVKKEQENE